MTLLYIVLGIVGGLVFLTLLTSFICFLITFYAAPEKPKEEFEIPPGAIYEPYRDIMVNWMKEARKLNPKEVSIKSFDGLTLYGKYYEYSKEILL